ASRPFRGGRGFGGGGGFGGPVTPPSAQDLQAQAEAYARLFSIFARHKGTVERVTLWGLSDRRSWRAAQHPLVFDADNRPKPAYAAIVDAARQPVPYPGG
ncbi:MAG TPA: endo-1,4-beta-xylanase, partial [Humisphaera sp.]